jgi:hypothetical protein
MQEAAWSQDEFPIIGGNQASPEPPLPRLRSCLAKIELCDGGKCPLSPQSPCTQVVASGMYQDDLRPLSVPTGMTLDGMASLT